ncbi:MAG: hypothetical protein WCK65_02860 [Rhodospirillaceae bacterium]
MLATVLATSTPTPNTGTSKLEGWREFKFGMTSGEVMTRLDGKGSIHAGGVRSTTQIEGVTYEVRMKFKRNRLHEIHLWSGVGYSKPHNDQQCLAYHAKITNELEVAHNIKSDNETSYIGSNTRYIFTHSKINFPAGESAAIDTKFVPALDSKGYCDSKITLRDTE